MAWVRIINESDATGALAELYTRWRRPIPLPEVVKVFSVRPELMDMRLRFQDRMTFGGSGLGRFREELIAVSILRSAAPWNVGISKRP